MDSETRRGSRPAPTSGVSLATGWQPRPALYQIQDLARHLFKVPVVLTLLRPGQPLREPLARALPHNFSAGAETFLLDRLAEGKCLILLGKEAAAPFAGSPSPAGLPRVSFLAGAPLLIDGHSVGGGVFLLDSRNRRQPASAMDGLRDVAALLARELRGWMAVLPNIGDFAPIDSWQSRYRELFEQAADIVLTHDLRGNVTAVNQAAERLTGYTRDELLQMSLLDLMAPESREAASQMVLSRYGGGATHSDQLIVRTRDDRRRHIDFRTHLLFDRGLPSGLIVFGREITALKQEIAARQAVESRLRQRTLELSLFGSHLAELFRLQTTEHPSEEDFLLDCLASGRNIFGMPTALVCRRQRESWIVQASIIDLEIEPRAPGSPVHLPLLNRMQDGLSLAGEFTDGSSGPAAVRSYLAAPIHVEGEFYGAAVFLSRHVREPASGQDEEILVALASVVGRGLEQRKLIEDRRRAAALQQEMMNGLELIARQTPLDEVLRRICLAAEDLAPESKCAVLLVDGNRTFWTIAPSLPYQVCRRMERLAIDLSVIQAAMQSGETSPGKPLSPAVFRKTHDPGEASWKTHWLDIESLQLQLIAALPVVCARDLRAFVVLYAPDRWPHEDVPSEVLEGLCRITTLALEQSDHTTQLRYLVRRDPLTGLPNRTRLLERVEELLRRTAAQGGHVALAAADLDGFSLLNEALGVHIGDQLLLAVAKRVQDWAPAQTMVARVAGDDFVVVLPNLASFEEAERQVRSLLEEIRRPFVIEGDHVYVTASIGASVSPNDGTSATELLGNAESAVRRAKNDGKNDIAFFAPAGAGERSSRRYLSNSLHGALASGEFHLSFQPQWTREGGVEVIEVLLGWTSPKHGRVPASEFIPLAEENGMIVPIGNWVLSQSCARSVEWQRAGLPAIRLALNVSALQFARSDFFDRVAHTLEISGLDPSLLELEITESVIMRNLDDAARRIARLRAFGVRVSIDDFGTGYSSLSYLRELPVDALKIDRSFLQGLTAPSAALSLVQSIVSMAHKIGLRVVAEGVETEEQRQLLLQAGCDRLQGNLLSRPLPEDGLLPLLARVRRL